MPWKSVKIDVEGAIKPCCSYAGSLGTFESTDDIFKYLEGSGLSELKARMQRGEYVHECRDCDSEEASGIVSIRENSVDRYPEPSDSIEELEISVTNVCNMVCVMCSPRFSSKWHAVEKDLIEKLSWPAPTQTRGRRLMLDANSFDDLRPILSDLTKLRIIGGEPFANPALLHLFAIWRERCPDKMLSITTNVSLISNEHIEAMRGLKGIELSCSIDGLGDTFEWIRGVKWEKIEAILFKLKAAEIFFKIEPTIQLVNAFNVLDLYRWSKAQGMGVRINHFLLRPDHLALRVLPNEQLTELRRVVDKLPAEDAGYFKSYLAKNQSEYGRLGLRAAQWIAEFDRMRGFRLSDTDSRLRI